MSQLEIGTTVRYEGSLVEFHGLYGWVEGQHPLNMPGLSVRDDTTEVRYSVHLSRRPSEGGGLVLHNVRQESVIVGPNPN